MHEDEESGNAVDSAHLEDLVRQHTTCSALRADYDSEATTPLISRRRVIYSAMTWKEVNTHTSFAGLIFNEEIEACIYGFCARSHIFTGAVWAVWSIGCITGLLVVARVLPLRFVWASLLMLPLPVVILLPMSVDLLREIWCSMGVYIISMLQFALIVDGVYFCHADERKVFWYCLAPFLLSACLVDAYPSKYRSFVGTLFFASAIAILIVWNALLIFRWEVLGDKGQLGLAKTSYLLHHASDQLTLVVLYSQNLYAAVFHPDRLTLIKADVVSGHKTITSAEGSFIAASSEQVIEPSRKSFLPISQSLEDFFSPRPSGTPHEAEHRKVTFRSM
jgi:hypothetical protein